jgi:hypothetical protein
VRPSLLSVSTIGKIEEADEENWDKKVGSNKNIDVSFQMDKTINRTFVGRD